VHAAGVSAQNGQLTTATTVPLSVGAVCGARHPPVPPLRTTLPLYRLSVFLWIPPPTRGAIPVGGANAMLHAVMVAQRLHAHVRSRRQLDLDEDLDLPAGSEVTVTVDAATARDAATAGDAAPGETPTVGEYDLYFRFPLDRAALHDDDR